MNPGCEFDANVVKKAQVNLGAVKRFADTLVSRRTLPDKDHQVAWLVNSLRCIDLTTLSGDDTCSNVQRLCHKAVHPVRTDVLAKLSLNEDLTVAAVCVYPAQVQHCVDTLASLGARMPVASVATGFPSGQYPLDTRIREIERVVQDGAREVDVVVNRELALTGKWQDVYDEVRRMKEACGPETHLKTILATGELGSLTNVYRASMVCMMAGADFIKTSTGKEAVNAILPVGYVMTMAIRDFFDSTGIKVGFKPAGGIRTSGEALVWQFLVNEQLGTGWLRPSLFRFGASGLLGDIELQLYRLAYGRTPAHGELPLQ